MDRSKGAIAMMATAVVQLGPAMIPACDSMSLLVDLGHYQWNHWVKTGTLTTAPALTMRGAHSRAIDAEVALITRSKPSKCPSSSDSTA
ncbi:MAG: hypothetical protein M3461_00700 [Pseudomonadota bacterium]|nr:hypothetical protein [Pseudomonadota bacterium]